MRIAPIIIYKELNSYSLHQMQGQQARFKRLLSYLPHPKQIRNVSIVAHVDHGKTTLADCLLSSNNIIHKKQAGQLRILDDRLDQQDRGITMKSSSISLVWTDCIINLIDSPGHLEFYSEVSSALRLTDSALLVVDTVEGVSSQTFRVLRQLYTQKLPAILILNKIDKLITSCKMEPMEAYHHLSQIIQQVNAILGSFIMGEIRQKGKERSNSEDLEQKKLDKLEDLFYFSPEKKNVIFGSALDNWGFAVESFAPLIGKKIGKDPKQLSKYLWGQHYFNPKTKEFMPQPRNQNDRPVCVQWILKPIWDIFQNVQNQNKEKIEKIIKTLELKVAENTKKTYNFQLIKEILNSWLPFDKIILSRIVEVMPNPIEAQAFRLPYLLKLNSRDEQIPNNIKDALENCSNDEKAPLIAFISKMVNIPKTNFNERGLNELKAEGDNRTLGFGRIFSGRIKRGAQVILIGAKKKKVQNQKGQMIQIAQITKARIDNLYLFNAQYPEGIEEAYAGNIVGFGNLQNHIYKSGTLSSDQNCISFIPISSQTKSILKVSVSTDSLQNNHKLLQGLKKLNKSDPSVDVYVQATGDIILNTCGQVHLQKCIVDLQNIYCKVPIKISDPIISFRQTITWTTLKQNKNEKYIMEAEKKKKIIQQKLQKEKYKEELLKDAELDDHEKEKQKAITEWDSHVEKYQSDDFTVEDIRYFLKNIDDEEEEKYSYKKEKDLKKIDHKNRGKHHVKQHFLNLNLKTNEKELATPNQLLKFKVKALGMNFQIAQYLQKKIDVMKKLFGENKNDKKEMFEQLMEQKVEFLKEFKEKLIEFGVQEGVCKLIQQKLVCFGPIGAGSNLLICQNIKKQNSLFEIVLNPKQYDKTQEYLQVPKDVLKVLELHKTSTSELLTSMKLGFTLASASGPLCNEQMMGVIFIVEQIVACEKQEIKIQKTQKVEKQEEKEKPEEPQKTQKKEEPPNGEQETIKNEKKAIDNFGPMAGQIASTIKQACLQAFLGGSPRLVQPMYLCQLHTQQKYQGSIHNQLSKRRATIISQDLHQFSNVFIIKAYLPMLQSNNLCFEILDKTQGTVNAQLNLDTWKIFKEDPFYTPLTVEEIQENGLQNVIFNPARILLQKIRQKKGLARTQKIVAAAQKQRTLKKN